MSAAPATGAPTEGLRWLRGRTRPGDRMPGPDLSLPHIRVRDVGLDPRVLAIMREARRAPGVGGVAGSDGRGAVPWSVPDGAEWDYEQAHGYRSHRVAAGGQNPWAAVGEGVTFDLEERELHWADPDPSELEDWDLAPVRRPERQLRGVHEDYSTWLIPTAEVEALIAEAEELFGDEGEWVNPRTRAAQERDAAEAENATEAAVAEYARKARKRATKRTTPAERAPLPPINTAGLPTNEAGAIDPVAWEEWWTSTG